MPRARGTVAPAAAGSGDALAESTSAVYDHVWFWRRFLGDRKGQACRRICQGRNGNVLIEFDDGYRTVAPRYAIRRA